MSLQTLHNWYLLNKRDLPWRNTQDPYYIWLSEVILQQTRVQQGLNYYYKFIEHYPSIFDLAAASQDEVLKLWQGLGYYSRARNMHETAKIIAKEYNGVFPGHSIALQKLKGIGEYTAAAIASFAFDEPVAVLDGNVFRVLSRLFQVETPINTGKGKKEFTAIANSFLDKANPAIHNQAIMELGALVCKPQNPLCEQCPLREICQSYSAKNQANYPVKLKKLQVKNRHFHYLYIHLNGEVQIKQRQKGDIWEGLFDLPLIEHATILDELALLEMLVECYPALKGASISIRKMTSLKHLLTHQRIYADFFEIVPQHSFPSIQDAKWVSLHQLKKFPASRLFEKFQESLILQEHKI